MQTISHYIKPVGGAQGQPLRADAPVFAPPEIVPVGLAARFELHLRPDGLADADPADLSGSITSWRFVMAADWNPATPPAFLCTDVAHEAGSGLWSLSLAGSRTCEMLLALGALGVVPIGFELAGIEDGGSWASPAYLLQWQGSVANRRDSGASPTPMPDDPIGGNALDLIRAALASVPSATPLTPGETADRVAAVVAALKAL